MDAAASRLADAVQRGGTVGLFADYDVDGATSAAQMARYLRAVGCPTLLHIPDRIDEGYGPNLPALRGLARSEEHTSELQSLMRISYAVFCLKKKTELEQ